MSKIGLDNSALKGLSGPEYRRAWNKLHMDRMRVVNARFRSRHPNLNKDAHQNFIKQHGVARTTLSSRKTEAVATMAREAWGPVEDTELLSGKTETQLTAVLGRTIRAIQRRKWRLRQNDINPHKQEAT